MYKQKIMAEETVHKSADHVQFAPNLTFKNFYSFINYTITSLWAVTCKFFGNFYDRSNE